MIIRITSDAKYGISNYLRYGLKNGSAMTRMQKDTVVPLEGNLDVFERIENFMHTHKDYKSGNYYHLTLSFSQQDMEKIDDIPDEFRRDFMRKLVQETLDFYCSGYDLNEIVCYAEAHIAKIKTNEKGEKRLDHIHLAVAKYSPMLDKAIRFRPFNLGIDNAFQTYLCHRCKCTPPCCWRTNHRFRNHHVETVGGLRHLGSLAFPQRATLGSCGRHRQPDQNPAQPLDRRTHQPL